jgi:hypothetical protein
LGGNGITYLNQRFRLFSILGANIDPEILKLGEFVLLLGCQKVRGLAGTNPGNRASSCPNGKGLTQKNRDIPAPDRLNHQVALLVYVHDHKAKLITVPCEHYPWGFLFAGFGGASDCDKVSVSIGTDLIGVRCGKTPYHLLNRCLKT